MMRVYLNDEVVAARRECRRNEELKKLRGVLLLPVIPVLIVAAMIIKLLGGAR